MARHRQGLGYVLSLSFAQCYKRKLWRNEIATKRRMASRLTKKTDKSDILFNLSTSGGLSGVRKQSEVFRKHLADVDQYEQLILLQNKAMMDTKIDKATQKLI